MTGSINRTADTITGSVESRSSRRRRVDIEEVVSRRRLGNSPIRTDTSNATQPTQISRRRIAFTSATFSRRERPTSPTRISRLTARLCGDVILRKVDIRWIIDNIPLGCDPVVRCWRPHHELDPVVMQAYIGN